MSDRRRHAFGVCRLGRAALFLLASALARNLAGCKQGGEGQACQLSGDAGVQTQCAEGLTCQTPRGCVNSYCCPTPASMSTNTSCNGTACSST